MDTESKARKTMPSSLRAIANKAAEQKRYRFENLYGLLNEENLLWSLSEYAKTLHVEWTG